MDLRVVGGIPTDPFLSIVDLFETEFELSCPVFVRVRDDPDSQTWVSYYQDHRVLNISWQAATSAMARRLTLHRLSHMARDEEGHVSHYQSMREAVFFVLAGHTAERRKLARCYQIVSHYENIYADDLTLSVTSADRLVRFLELQPAVAFVDRPQASGRLGSRLVTVGSDPGITAANAGFALALVEQHDFIESDHRLYGLVHATGDNAPPVSLEMFEEHFRTLTDDSSKGEHC